MVVSFQVSQCRTQVALTLEHDLWKCWTRSIVFIVSPGMRLVLGPCRAVLAMPSDVRESLCAL